MGPTHGFHLEYLGSSWLIYKNKWSNIVFFCSINTLNNIKQANDKYNLLVSIPAIVSASRPVKKGAENVLKKKKTVRMEIVLFSSLNGT